MHIQRKENIDQWLETFQPRIEYVQSGLAGRIEAKTEEESAIYDTLQPRYDERDSLLEQIKGMDEDDLTEDGDSRDDLIMELNKLQSVISREEKLLEVVGRILETYLKDSEKLDGMLEGILKQEKQLGDKAKDAEYYIQEKSDASEKALFEKHNARKEKILESGKFDLGLDMYIRTKEPEDRTPEEETWLANQNEKHRKPYYDKLRKERKYRENLELRQDFMNDSRVAGNIGNLVGNIPGSMWARYEAKKDVDVQLEERLKEINTGHRESVEDIEDDLSISKRQQLLQIERLTERHNDRVKELHKDAAEAKKKLDDSVVSNFMNGIKKMIGEEIQLRLARTVADKVLGFMGWNADVSNAVIKKRACPIR